MRGAALADTKGTLDLRPRTFIRCGGKTGKTRARTNRRRNRVMTQRLAALGRTAILSKGSVSDQSLHATRGTEAMHSGTRAE